MALKLKGSTSGFVGLDAPAVAGNNTLILPENSGSAFQIFANDITAGVTTFTQVTVSRNGDLTVPGTISIGGTLTYEDVTSVDSVGVVTARGLSIFGNTTGLNVASGISTFLDISARNVNVSGVSTFASTVDINGDTTFGANGQITASANFSLSGNKLRVTGSDTVGIEVQRASNATIQCTETTNSTDLQLRANATGGLVRTATNKPLILATYQQERVRITGAGLVGINSTSPTHNLDINSSSNPYIKLRRTGYNPVYIGNAAGEGVIETTGDTFIKTGGSERVRISSAGQATFDKGAPGSSNQTIARFQAASSRALDIVWHDSGSLMGFDTPGNHNYIFKCNGAEKLRLANDGELFVGASYHGYSNRSTLLSVTGPYQNPTGVWTQVGIYSDDGQAQDKGGTIGFGGQDGSVPQQQFAAIKGAKVNGTSGNYAGYMAFYTRPAGDVSIERMRLDEAGRIGMGVNPSYGRVHSAPISFNPWSANGTWLSGASYVAAGGYGGGYSILDGSKGWSISGYDNGQDIYIKHHNSTTAAGTGGVYINDGGTSWQSASDERDKENLVNITDAITKVKTLRTVIGNYTWKPEVKTPFLIAQDVQSVLPEAVTIRNKNEEGEEERLGMSYQSVIPLVTAALKEAIAEIETLKSKVAALEGS